MYTFRWRCNKNIALTNKLNTSKNEAGIGKDHLGNSAEQTVGTEFLIETEVSTPDSANDLHLSCAAHQVKMSADHTSRNAAWKKIDRLKKLPKVPFDLSSESDEDDDILPSVSDIPPVSDIPSVSDIASVSDIPS
ncbi:uncharacterized protein LOC131214242, partial [Anopheles bellator]|uniref:uncharacterized protein LOC131214242 n=1 Tax=Anopheles bellator TaxID=139047 RepID=UPI002647D0AC